MLPSGLSSNIFLATGPAPCKGHKKALHQCFASLRERLSSLILLEGGMCVMHLSCSHLPAQRDKMEHLTNTLEAGCCEMQTAGKCVILMSF